MLVDTGAQVSLINNNIITNQSLINPENKITISSIHGSEDTLGDISATIHKNNTEIPIQLQVTNNKLLKEDGILGYDIIGEKVIIDGPNKKLFLNAGNTVLTFPVKSHRNQNVINTIKINDEIQSLGNIEYLSQNEINPHYERNLKGVKTITHQISPKKIKIIPIHNEQT